jgi:hypothetical protein
MKVHAERATCLEAIRPLVAALIDQNTSDARTTVLAIAVGVAFSSGIGLLLVLH